MPDMKQEIQRKYPQVQLFFYEPTYPRKHLTILLIGPWQLVVAAKKDIEVESNKILNKQDTSFEAF